MLAGWRYYEDEGGHTVENFILSHTVWIPVAAKPDDYQTVFFGHDSLVDVPASLEMGEDDGTHVVCVCVCVCVCV